MNKLAQQGRTMIEMIGVLGIVGVLIVGGFSIVAKALKNQRYTQVMNDAAEIASYAKKMSCQYLDDGAYADYGIFLYKSAKYPDSLEYDKSTGEYFGVMDVTYKVSAPNNGSSAFTVTIKHVPGDLCIRMVSDDWGSVSSTGFHELSLNQNQRAVKMDLNEAVLKCTDYENTIDLIYYGCRKGI